MKDTFLSDAKIIKVSTITLDGIELLKKEVINISNNKVAKFDRGIFRMFIDRVFTKKGFGTVVTGTVLSGEARKGQQIEILPILEITNIIVKDYQDYIRSCSHKWMKQNIMIDSPKIGLHWLMTNTTCIYDLLK